MSNSNGIIANRMKFSDLINTNTYQKLIANVLQDPAQRQRFVASITSAVAVNPALQECVPKTIIAGALLGESLNLSPSPQLGQYYLVPFKCKVKDENGKIKYLTDEKGRKLTDANGRWIPETVNNAQFVLGYKGYFQLAIRSGVYKKIYVIEVREGEYLGRNAENGDYRFRFIEDDDERESLPVVGYMGRLEYLSGYDHIEYWSKKKMLAHANEFSSAFSKQAYEDIQAGKVADEDMWKYSSFWYKNFDAMAQKTVIRHMISQYGEMSIDPRIPKALESDSKFINIDSNGDIVSIQEDPAEAIQPEPSAPVEPKTEQPVKTVSLADL